MIAPGGGSYRANFNQQKHPEINGIATKSGDISQNLLENKILENIFVKVITSCYRIAVFDTTLLIKILGFLVYFKQIVTSTLGDNYGKFLEHK